MAEEQGTVFLVYTDKGQRECKAGTSVFPGHVSEGECQFET